MAETSRGWMLLLIASICLLSTIQCDLTTFHLHNYLNHSVSPCSDFYHHVCSNDMHANESVTKKSAQFYRDLARRIDSRSRNNALMNDIASARKRGKCTYKSQPYENRIQKRCGKEISCYRSEFSYFYNIYKDKRNPQPPHDNLRYFVTHLDKANNISQLIHVTSKMIELVIENTAGDFQKLVNPYEELRDRLSFITEFESSNSTIKDVLKIVQKLTKNVKNATSSRLTATAWLNDTDYFGFDRLPAFQTALSNMKIQSDFDKLDANLTLWRTIDRLYTVKYFDYSKRTTGCSQFDVMHPFLTLNNEMETILKTEKDWQIHERLDNGFYYNAFHYRNYNTILLLSPFFYPFLWKNSSQLSQLGFAAHLGHEIMHSFILSDLSESSDAFKQEADCLMAHFNASCAVWADDTCNSGSQTFAEDASDVEGLRIAYDLLKMKYNETELKVLEYEELEITREQAFFYSVGARFCHNAKYKPEHVHSMDIIRLNGMVSMMPEFSEAFGCEKGDEEYAEESTSCYLFGPRAGLRGTEEETDEMDEDQTEDQSEGSGEVIAEEGSGEN